jgi:phosphoribosylformimino-5-aminoimidazole carboxamide ribotide isomerase
MGFEVIPAIDVRNGFVVRLAQGDYGRETRFTADPVALARQYEVLGARWLHLVDLDAARTGGYGLQRLVGRMLAGTSLRIQSGGGVRDESAVEALLGQGVERVVVGTVAARHPRRACDWIRRFGADRIVLALDVREVAGQWRVLTSGWTQDGGARLDPLLGLFADAGARHVLCTDVSRDGMLTGFNLGLYRRITQAFPTLCLQASGGARGPDDIQGVRAAGAGGAIVGRAILEGRFDLPEAFAC